MVEFIKALENTYNKKATVIIFENTEIDNLISDSIEVIKYKDIKCDISFKSNNISSIAIQNETPKAVMQIKMFLSNEYYIPINSKIIVQDEKGRIETYTSSSLPAIYDTHQEIILEKMDREGTINA